MEPGESTVPQVKNEAVAAGTHASPRISTQLHTISVQQGNSQLMTNSQRPPFGTPMYNLPSQPMLRGPLSLPPPPPRQQEKKEPDTLFPIANISRIMKRVLPRNAAISKECLLSVQQCVADFISFVTSEAGAHCLQEKRKTVSGDDITFALNNMGFDNYGQLLKIYLQKYRESKDDVNRPGKKSRPDDDLSDG